MSDQSTSATRLPDLCKAVRDGSARPNDVQELAKLAEQAQKKIDAAEKTIEGWEKTAEHLGRWSERGSVYRACARELKKEMW